MDELATAERDPHMRSPWRDGFEKHEVSGLDVVGVDIAADSILVLHLARESQPLLREHPLYEAAAVEPGEVAATVPIGGSAQRQSERDDPGLNGDRLSCTHIFGEGPGRNRGARERPWCGDRALGGAACGEDRNQNPEHPNPARRRAKRFGEASP